MKENISEHSWLIPFIASYKCAYFTWPEDDCVQVSGEISVYTNSLEEAKQKAEIRLSRLGYNSVIILEEDCKRVQ